MIKIDNDYYLDSDKDNIILVEKSINKKTGEETATGRRRFYPNLKMMAKAMADLKAYNFLDRGMLDSYDKSSISPTHAPLIKHLDEVIDEYSEYLQEHHGRQVSRSRTM